MQNQEIFCQLFVKAPGKLEFVVQFVENVLFSHKQEAYPSVSNDRNYIEHECQKNSNC